MSENPLVQIAPPPLAVPSGAQVNFKSRFMHTKPATLTINQPNTQAEGAVRGHLRIIEQNLQFSEMTVTLLAEPGESRAWYAGERGQMNRTADNLMCFSQDLQKPDKRAKVPQAMQCGRFEFNQQYGRHTWVDTCPKASWEAWREKRDKEGIKDPKLIPQCEKSLKVALIDTVYKIPLVMYLRSNTKSAFEDELQQVSRAFQLLAEQRRQKQLPAPNWFDLSFQLSTVPKKNNNGTVSYVPKISNVKAITDEERALFGDLFLSYTNRGGPSANELQQAEAEAAVADSNRAIDAEIVGEASSPARAAEIVNAEIVI